MHPKYYAVVTEIPGVRDLHRYTARVSTVYEAERLALTVIRDRYKREGKVICAFESVTPIIET